MVAVRQRPHLAAFLERVAQLFEVVIFTASQKARCMCCAAAAFVDGVNDGFLQR